MARKHFAFLVLAATAVAAACSTETGTNPVDATAGTGASAGTSSGTSMSSSTGGDTTSSSGSGGGQGGSGGGAAEKLEVGVGKQSITPTIQEVWADLNQNGYKEDNEPFIDDDMDGVFDAVWIAGFGTGRPALGVNDELEARAIAVKHGDQTVVICVLDVIGYFIDDIEKIKADPMVAGLNVDHIIIGSTHTHEGVDTIGLWGPDEMTTGRNDEYQKLTRDRAALAIKEAVESMKPAKMRVAQVQTVDRNGSTLQYVTDSRDPIIYDPTVTIAQFTDEADPAKTIGTLVNWAAHPEYSGSKNNQLSADYVHWLREVVEQGVPAEQINGLGGMTVFVQGPLGGQIGPGGSTVGPLDPDGKPINMQGLPKAQAAGTNVAKLALDALATSGEDATSTEITLRTVEIKARIDNTLYHAGLTFGIFERQLYDYDDTMPISDTNVPWLKSRITYLQVGPLAMITSPGELHPELWVGGYDGSWSWGQSILNEQQNKPDLAMAPAPPYLREVMLSNPGVKYAFTAGLAEDFIGYIVASFNYVLDDQNPYFVEAQGDHYEETNSLGPEVEAQVQHPMLELAKPPAN